MNKLILGCTAILVLAVFRPAPAAETGLIPPEIQHQMKSGKKGGRTWINPKFDPSQGFVIGKTECRVDEEGQADSTAYLREAMARMELPGSPNTLTAHVVQLDVKAPTPSERNNLGFTAGLVGVEALVTDPNGAPMLAFYAMEKSGSRESVLANRRAAIDKIALTLALDLGDSFQRALEARANAAGNPVPSAFQPPPPPLQNDALDVQGRLLRLEGLRKQGLITAEEYQSHKAKILSGS